MGHFMHCCMTVSYTHLDVYKRQAWNRDHFLSAVEKQSKYGGKRIEILQSDRAGVHWQLLTKPDDGDDDDSDGFGDDDVGGVKDCTNGDGGGDGDGDEDEVNYDDDDGGCCDPCDCDDGGGVAGDG